MTQLRELAESKRDHFMFAPEKIRMDHDYNIRDLDTPEAQVSLEVLASSIAESGLRVPLLVRLDGEDVILVQGHRRFRAIQMLIARGIPFLTVECLAEAKRRDEADRTLDIFLSNDGEPLTELEKAEGIRRLISYGWDQAMIAKKLGRSASYVSHLMALTHMPEPVKDMVRAGEVSAATALNTMRSQGEVNGTEILRDAVRDAIENAPSVDDLRSINEPPLIPLDNNPPRDSPPTPRATPKRVKEATERKAAAKDPSPRQKKTGHTLGAVLTEKVSAFLIAIVTHKYDEDDAKLDRDAQTLLDLMTREIAGM